MRFGRTNRRDNTLSNPGKHGLFTGTPHQLSDIGPDSYPGLGDQLDPVLGNSCYRRCVNHPWIHRHLDRIEDSTTGQVNGRGHLESEFNVGFAGRDQCMDHLFHMSACQVMCLQLVTFDGSESRFVCFDH